MTGGHAQEVPGRIRGHFRLKALIMKKGPACKVETRHAPATHGGDLRRSKAMIIVVLSASFASVIAQMQTLRARPVVRLPASQVVLGANVGGMSLELLNASPILNLPSRPPKLDAQGRPWAIDVNNLGPRLVTVVGPAQFSVAVHVKGLVHIYSNGSRYGLRPFVPQDDTAP